MVAHDLCGKLLGDERTTTTTDRSGGKRSRIGIQANELLRKSRVGALFTAARRRTVLLGLKKSPWGCEPS